MTESPWVSWTFGWMELLGQIASVCGVGVWFAEFCQATIVLKTGGANMTITPQTAAGIQRGVDNTQAASA